MTPGIAWRFGLCSIVCESDQGIEIVRQNESLLLRSPSQNFRVLFSAKAHVLGADILTLGCRATMAR